MSDELKKYLADILKAVAEIDTFVGEKKNYKRFQRSAMLRAAIERKIEIIGEAMGQALKLDANLPITNARKIVDTRNKFIHGYDEIDKVMIWEIVVKHLPILKTEVQTLLDN